MPVPTAQRFAGGWWLPAAGTAVATFILTATLYAGAMVATIPSDIVPNSYKWLLLKSLPRPRLIVAGGSNAHHAVDADTLGRAFGLTGINIADNASFALAERVSAIERYAGPGDVVLMMLEWQQYAEGVGANDFYMQFMLGRAPEYFWVASPRRQAEVLFALPLATAIERLAANVTSALDASGYGRALDDRIDALRDAALGPAPNGSSAATVGAPLLPMYAQIACDAWVDGMLSAIEPLPAATLRELDRLAAAQTRGVDIVFTWPAVTGNGCYGDESRVDAVADRIAAAVRSRGMRVVGRPEDFLFGPEYSNESYFHVVEAGRRIVTDRLVALLQAAGIASRSAPPMPISTLALAAIERIRADVGRSDPWPGDEVTPGTLIDAGAPAGDLLLWRGGWSGQEDSGRWSADRQSFVRIAATPPMSLGLAMWTFDAPRRVTVTVNGTVLAHLTVEADLRTLPVAVPESLPGQCCEIGLWLDDGPPVSPASRHMGSDTRPLGVFLRSIEVSAP